MLLGWAKIDGSMDLVSYEVLVWWIRRCCWQEEGRVRKRERRMKVILPLHDDISLYKWKPVLEHMITSTINACQWNHENLFIQTSASSTPSSCPFKCICNLLSLVANHSFCHSKIFIDKFLTAFFERKNLAKLEAEYLDEVCTAGLLYPIGSGQQLFSKTSWQKLLTLCIFQHFTG